MFREQFVRPSICECDHEFFLHHKNGKSHLCYGCDCTGYKARKKVKYGNKRTDYNGISYRSAGEAQYAWELDQRQKAGDIKSWEREVPIILVDDANPRSRRRYYIDFVIHHNDGTTEYVEVKGFRTKLWELKWALFEKMMAGDPMVKLRVVKVR